MYNFIHRCRHILFAKLFAFFIATAVYSSGPNIHTLDEQKIHLPRTVVLKAPGTAPTLQDVREQATRNTSPHVHTLASSHRSSHAPQRSPHIHTLESCQPPRLTPSLEHMLQDHIYHFVCTLHKAALATQDTFKGLSSSERRSLKDDFETIPVQKDSDPFESLDPNNLAYIVGDSKADAFESKPEFQKLLETKKNTLKMLLEPQIAFKILFSRNRNLIVKALKKEFLINPASYHGKVDHILGDEAPIPYWAPLIRLLSVGGLASDVLAKESGLTFDDPKLNIPEYTAESFEDGILHDTPLITRCLAVIHEIQTKTKLQVKILFNTKGSPVEVDALTRLVALSQGIIIISLPHNFEDAYKLISHNELRNITRITLMRSIICDLGDTLFSELVGAAHAQCPGDQSYLQAHAQLLLDHLTNTVGSGHFDNKKKSRLLMEILLASHATHLSPVILPYTHYHTHLTQDTLFRQAAKQLMPQRSLLTNARLLSLGLCDIPTLTHPKTIETYNSEVRQEWLLPPASKNERLWFSIDEVCSIAENSFDFIKTNLAPQFCPEGDPFTLSKWLKGLRERHQEIPFRIHCYLYPGTVCFPILIDGEILSIFMPDQDSLLKIKTPLQYLVATRSYSTLQILRKPLQNGAEDWSYIGVALTFDLLMEHITDRSHLVAIPEKFASQTPPFPMFYS